MLLDIIEHQGVGVKFAVTVNHLTNSHSPHCHSFSKFKIVTVLNSGGVIINGPQIWWHFHLLTVFNLSYLNLTKFEVVVQTSV